MNNVGKYLCEQKRDYKIFVKITNMCNLKCSFCYEKHSKILFDNEKIIDSIEYAISKIEKGETIKLFFFGGEPMLNYDRIYSIVDKVIKHDNIVYYIVGNGLFDYRYYLEIGQYIYLKTHRKINIKIGCEGNREGFIENRKIDRYNDVVSTIEKLVKSNLFNEVWVNSFFKNSLDVEKHSFFNNNSIIQNVMTELRHKTDTSFINDLRYKIDKNIIQTKEKDFVVEYYYDRFFRNKSNDCNFICGILPNGDFEICNRVESLPSFSTNKQIKEGLFSKSNIKSKECSFSFEDNEVDKRVIAVFEENFTNLPNNRPVYGKISNDNVKILIKCYNLKLSSVITDNGYYINETGEVYYSYNDIEPIGNIYDKYFMFFKKRGTGC